MATTPSTSGNVMGSEARSLKEIEGNINNYRERFNTMYELGYDLSWFDLEVPQEVRDYINLLISAGLLDSKKSKIMDLGCGRGQLLRYLEKKFNQVTGVDVSDFAVRHAKKRTEQSHIVMGDAINGLPFHSGTFSLVIELTVLSSFNPQYWPGMLDEISRVLTSGGLYISEFFKREDEFDLDKPLITRSAIPRELDQVFGVTKNELLDIFGQHFLIKECNTFISEQDNSFFVLAQKLS